MARLTYEIWVYPDGSEEVFVNGVSQGRTKPRPRRWHIGAAVDVQGHDLTGTINVQNQPITGKGQMTPTPEDPKFDPRSRRFNDDAMKPPGGLADPPEDEGLPKDE